MMLWVLTVVMAGLAFAYVTVRRKRKGQPVKRAA
jgi:hypothetical protein